MSLGVLTQIPDDDAERSSVADEIPLDVIDVLLSCSDFEEFKILMLSFKQNETPNFEIMGDALVCVGE